MSDALQDAIAEAVAEKGEAFLTEGEAPTPPAATPGEGQPSKGTDSGSTEGAAEGTTSVVDSGEGGEQQDPPDDYWGVSLEGIPAEKRAELIAHFEQQDSTIHKLQAKLAEEPKVEPPSLTESVETEEVSDDDLLRAIGLDPEDFNTQQLAPTVLPLARTVLALEDQVSGITQRDQVREVETTWNRAIDELEGTYGKLPVERVQALKYAVDEGIASPFELYFRITAPVRREVEDVVSKARQEAGRAAAAGGLKPSTSAAGNPPVTPEMSLHEAVAAAAQAAEEETGKKWSSIFKR